MTDPNAPPARRNGGRLTQAERSAISDEKLFDAAIRLILERGTQKATLKEIGERAGYSRGLVTYRFGSKDGLIQALIKRFEYNWAQRLESFVSGRTGLSAIVAAADAVEQFLLSELDYMRGMYIVWYESVGHESLIKQRLAEHHRIYRGDIRRWIEQGIAGGEIDPRVNVGAFAVQFCSFVFGTVYQWLVNPDAFDIDELFGDFKRNVLAVLRDPSADDRTGSAERDHTC